MFSLLHFVYLCLVYLLYCSSVTVQAQCSEGFPTQSFINDSIAGATGRAGLQLFFFSMNFTCEAEISRVIIAALEATPGLQTLEYPLMETWRQNNNGLYNRVNHIGSVEREVTSLNFSIYQYTPDQPTTVLPGDIFGMRIIPNNGSLRTRLLPYFVDQGSNAPEYFEREITPSTMLTDIFVNPSDRKNQYFPLVTVEIIISSSTSTIVFIPSTTTTDSEPSPSSSNTIVNTPSVSVSSQDISTTITSSLTILSMTGEPITSMSSIPTMSMSTSVTTSSITTSSVITSSLTSVQSTTTSTLIVSSIPSETQPPTSQSVPVSTPPLVTITDGTPQSTAPSSSVIIPGIGPTGSSLSTAALAGAVVSGLLIIIIIALVFILILLFALGKRRYKERSYTPTVHTNGQVDTYPMDNPTYLGVISKAAENGVESTTSTMTSDNFVNHYDVPGYQDPVNSPTAFYDEAHVTSSSAAIYDQAQDNGENTGPLLTSIYHELVSDDIEGHYEMGNTASAPELPSNHYEMDESRYPLGENGIYEIEPYASAAYEKPVSSRTNTLKNSTNQHTLNNDDTMTQPVPSAHDYSVLDNDICVVPTEEERQVVGKSNTESAMFDDRSYAQLGVIQRQKYENIMFFEKSDIYWRPAAQANVLYDQLAKRKYREIPRNKLKITKHLGSGQFGTVSEGVWQSPQGPLGMAVKMVTTNSPEEEKVKLLQEAAIMGQFSHPNVVQLYGVVTVGEPVMIIIELMQRGDLHNYLKSIRPRSGDTVDSSLPNQFLEFCKQVANGMNYLSKKSFVHRDLAARNIFLDENNICKIGDFGMSRDLEDENYYVSHGGKIPVKWTAPEALQYKRYSTASDVWSFAALMYEIWSVGHKPFEGFSNPQTLDLVQSGYRLPPPPGCPRTIYQLMIHCWHPDSSRRPTFANVLRSLSDNPQTILSWRDVDKAVHEQASVLGAPLAASQDLYSELQQTFVRYSIKI